MKMNRNWKGRTSKRIGAGSGTHTPPATPPATSDLQMVRSWCPGPLTSSRARFASSARLTIVVTAVSPLVLPTTSSDAITLSSAASAAGPLTRPDRRSGGGGGGGGRRDGLGSGRGFGGGGGGGEGWKGACACGEEEADARGEEVVGINLFRRLVVDVISPSALAWNC